MSMNDVLARVRAAKKVTAEDALAARRAVYGNDGGIDPAEIEAMFAIDEAADKVDPAWTMLLVEAGTDYIVHQRKPSGYIDEANADWLIARIGKDGVVKTATELAASHQGSRGGRDLAGEAGEIRASPGAERVVDGSGPLADGDDLQPGRVGRAEVELVRRILYAFGGDAGIAITRAEAEVLFDINDRTVEADNDPAWTDLFVKAIANCIMAASGYVVPPRDVALRREEWLDTPAGGVGDFFSRMVAGGLRGVIDAYTTPSGEHALAGRNHRMEQAIAEAEMIDEDEAGWLAERIGRDGKFHANEKALLRFIHDEAPEVHPALKPLIDKAA